MVADHRAQPQGRVDQDLAVEHPQSRVVGKERTLPLLVRPDQDRVEVDVTSKRVVTRSGKPAVSGLPVLGPTGRPALREIVHTT